MSDQEKKLTPWEKYKQNMGEVKPWDVLNPKTEWLDDDVSSKRLSICRSCPELIKLTEQCKKCGCFMAIKTKIEKATCPMEKW
jgi:hypothetical protein